MSDKDWFDDFMDYKLSRDSKNKNTQKAPKQTGCLSSILGIFIVIWLIVQLFG